MAGLRKGSREKAFSQRLTRTLDDHPRCPDEYGRLTWIKRELEHHHVSVSIETIRKWLNAKTMPRREKMAALAKMLRVDETWLAMGTQQVDGVNSSRQNELETAIRDIAKARDMVEVQKIVQRVLPKGI